MALTSARKIQTICRNCCDLQFRVPLLFIAALAGCNTCVTFTSPNGTLGIVASDPRPACTLPKMNAAVRPQLAAEPVCSSCIGSGQVQHIFLTIRGIELNSSATAHDDSPDWQELWLPELEQRPLQIDLLESNAAQGVREPFGRTALIPAGIYRQLRLRFVPDQPAAADPLPERNMCGDGKYNCIVTADGSIQPLLLDKGSSEFRITPDRMEGAVLPLLSGTDTDLIIAWKLVWELSSSADAGVRLRPALAASAKVRRIELDGLGTPEAGVVNDSQSR